MVDVVEVRAGSLQILFLYFQNSNIFTFFSEKCNAISIVEADLEVDFDKPLDASPSPTTTHVTPNIFNQKQPSATAIPGPSSSSSSASASSGLTSEENAWKEILKAKLKKNKEENKKEGGDEKGEQKPNFVAFAGSGRRLDSGAGEKNPFFKGFASSSTSVVSPKKEEEEKKKDEQEKSTFKPFAGPGRSLK